MGRRHALRFRRRHHTCKRKIAQTSNPALQRIGEVRPQHRDNRSASRRSDAGMDLLDLRAGKVGEVEGIRRHAAVAPGDAERHCADWLRWRDTRKRC
eukprot:645389-Rhodomonas_salina.1